MAIIYGPQDFTAGTFAHAASFNSNLFGGPDAPIAGYPEIAHVTNLKTVDGAGPLGERVADLDNSAPPFDDYSYAGLVMLAMGDAVDGQWDSTPGIIVEWDQFFSATALNDSFVGQSMVLTARISTSVGPSVDPQSGMFTGDSFIWLGFEQTAGANFFHDFSYIAGGIVVFPSDIPDVADNAWHRLKIRYKPGTINGPISGLVYSCDSDGYIELLKDGVSIYSAENIPLQVPTKTFYGTAPNMGYGAWHGFAGALGAFTNFTISTEEEVSASPEPEETEVPDPVLVDSVAPECCDHGNQSPTAGAVLDMFDPTWIKDCAGGGSVPLAADNIDPESWIT